MVETACALNQTGRATVDIALLQGENAYAERLREAGVPVHDLALRHRYDVAGGPRLASLVRSHGIDVLHAHLLPAMIPAVFARQRLKVPLVFTEHNVWNRRRRFRSVRHVERWLYARVDRLLCVSRSVRDALIAWIPEAGRRAEVLHNGVPVRLFGERVETKYDVIFVGNMDQPAKGADVLLRALAACGNHLGRACVVGEGRLRPELERLRDELGLRHKVEFVGSSDQVGSLLEASRVFVLPSRWEGLPMAILEAMERGLPVLASSVGGIPEAVDDKVTGLLVTSGSVEQLAAGIRKLLEDVEMASRMGRAGRERIVGEFSAEKCGARLLDCYDAAIGHPVSESSVAGAE